MPIITYINAHDEAKYVESGWILLSHGFRDIAWGPLVAFVYAPVDLLVGGSSDWFMIELWVGRYILFLGMWFAAYHLLTQLRPGVSPWVVCGTLLVALPFSPILENQADALFLCLSMLGLARFLAYYHQRRPRDLCLSSLLVGLGVLARYESILLIGVLVFLALIVSWREQSRLSVVSRALLPAVAVLAVWALVNLATSGTPNLSSGDKAYDSFEWNQSVLTGGDLALAKTETERLFGTREENGGSVARAVLRNPEAFAQRILANIRGIPDYYMTFFGKRLAPTLALFALWGLYSLARSRRLHDMAIVAIWAAPASVSLGFLARHFIPQTAFVPLALGAVGIGYVFGSSIRTPERIVVLLSMLALGAYGLADNKLALLPGAILVASLIAFGLLSGRTAIPSHREGSIPLLLLLAVGIILRGPFPFPNYPSVGVLPEEEAIHFLQRALPRRSTILVHSPRPAVAARMLDADPLGLPQGLDSPQQVADLLRERQISAVYLDLRYETRADLVAQLQAGLGTEFLLGYSSEDGTVKVFLVEGSTNSQPVN